jgi:hypothetical protein
MQDNQSQTHWAYIAGIMDADGCFMIFKHKRKTKNRETPRAIAFPKVVKAWAITYLPGVKIAMVEPEAINLILNELKFGYMHIDGARKSRPNSKPIFHWYMRDKNRVALFIENILPYLRVKKNRALHLLEYCKHVQATPSCGYKGLSIEELNYREDMYCKMREFNGNKVGATTKSFGPEKVCDSLIS